VEIEHVIEQKAHVAQRGFVIRHGHAPADSRDR
jgi:hypothetical protein